MVTTTELPAEVEGWAREIHGDTESLVRPDGMRTYSLKKRRFYDRRFNHDRARALHADGTSYRRIANQLGVSENSILFAVDVDARARAQKLSKASATRTCEQCFGPAIRADHSIRRRHAIASGEDDGRTLCRVCRSQAMRTGIRYSQEDGSVTLWCGTCDAWKPADAFGRGRRYPDIRDGGFHAMCLVCASHARSAYRARNKVPCEDGCGALVEGKGRGNRVGADPARPHICLPCWHKRRNAA